MTDVLPEFTIHDPSAIEEIGSLRGVLAEYYKPSADNDQAWLHELDNATIVEVLGGTDGRPPTDGEDVVAAAGIPDEVGKVALQIIKKDYSPIGRNEEEFGIKIIDGAGHMMSMHRLVHHYDIDNGDARVTKNDETTEKIQINNLEEMQTFTGRALHLIGLEPAAV